MMEHHQFSAVVFAGGGSRCAWQVGFWDEIAPVMEKAPDTVAAVSAGAAMACFIFSNCVSGAMDYFKEITGKNPRNFYIKNIIGDRPVFPHLKMLRSTLLKFLNEERLRILHQGPDVRILLTRPPAWAGPRLSVFCGLLCYQIEKSLNSPLHPSLPEKLGYRPEVVTVRDCTSPEQLTDLIIASSSTPPITPIRYWNGRLVIDGGLIDNVPERALSNLNGNILYLLTRRYPDRVIPSIPGRVYIQPSRPIGIPKWDYTNPTGFQEAYDLGREDGRAYLSVKRI